jgi:hypothetical protein
MKYQDSVILFDARAQYFSDSGFPSDGGYSARWVKIQLGPAPLSLYNSKARVRAVRYHDLHHILTEYETTLTGEAEIAAWELASGCRRYLAAWILNIGALLVGLMLSPKKVVVAYKRGRKSSNLYGREFSQELLSTSIGKLRSELGLVAHGRKRSTL